MKNKLPETTKAFKLVCAKMPRRSPPKLLSQRRSTETFETYQQIATLCQARFGFIFQDAGFYQLSRARWDSQKKKKKMPVSSPPSFPFPFFF